MKTCGFENLINLYLDNELSGAKLRSFEAHLRECPRCREEVEQYRGMLDALHGLEVREVPPALQERLHAALSNEISKGDGRVKRKLNPWALTAVAAALVVFVVGGAMLAGGGFLSAKNQAPDKFLSMRNADLSGGNTGQGMAENESQGKATNYGTAPEPMPAATMAPEAPRMDTNKAETRSSAQNDGKSLAGTDSLTKPEEGRKIIYTAYLVVETREYDKCMGIVNALLEKYGGYKESSQEYGVPDATVSTSGRTAVISIRMPINKYDAAMGEMQAMGNVLSKNESTEDVSRQYVDTEARNKTLAMQREKLYDLLAKADNMENIIALQNEISRLTVEIEQMTAQLRFWDDKVSYSTITVELKELVTPKTVKPVDPDLNDRMNGAWNSTLNNMKAGLEDFTVRFIGFLPWLAIILLAAAILTAVLIPVARRARKNKKTEDKQKEE